MITKDVFDAFLVGYVTGSLATVLLNLPAFKVRHILVLAAVYGSLLVLRLSM